MEFDAVIGLEIHVEMKTKSKMFSSGPVTFGQTPNTQVNIFDMGFPGVMPVVNKQAVINALRMCNALHMEIDDTIVFERKNYYYSDLPKGYQITQEFRPLGKNGYLDIGSKTIGIERLHMEEDTCKQLHYSDFTLLDYNRAGIPLLEIVSKHEITNGIEAAKFVEKIRSIATYLGVSDGKMERGSIRCDVNISLKEKGTSKLGTKVEIKNLNSISNIEKALDYEIARQSKLLEKGESVKQETRRFDESKKQTVSMRVKQDAVDYKFFTDPNIAPIKLAKEFIVNTIKTSPELAESKIQRYKTLGLSEYTTKQLTDDKEISEYFDQGIKLGANPKLLANWIIGDIQSVLNKEEISITQFKIAPSKMVELLNLIECGKISNAQAKKFFGEILKKDISIEELLTKNGTLVNDEKILQKIVIEVLNSNSQTITDYKNGKDKALGYLVGLVMKKTNGKANPVVVNKLILEELERR